MKKITLKAAFNSLSFGNVSYNIARELFKKDFKVSLFPIGDNFDFSAFDKLDTDFRKWLESSANTRLTTMSRDNPSLSIWHLNGSHESIGVNNFLYTFYELNNPTFTEKNISEMYKKTIFSSSHAKNCFENVNCENVENVPLGFDEDFYKTNKVYLKDKLHFGLIGKWEKRKNTAKILKAWAKKYGNNSDYQLSCCIINPFFKNEDINAMIGQALDGKVYGNINFLPRLKTNSEINELMNSIDIDLSGLSGAEGWNLPSFNSTCLGKWSIVLNNTSHKDWATKENSILIDSDDYEPAEDGIFFHKNSPFNQGEINSISEESLMKAFEKSESFKGKDNIEGERLKEKFTYENTVNSILDIINV